MMNWVLGFICVWVLLHVVRINGRESSSLRCLTSICTPQVCQPGEKLQKDINDCCPVCKPSRPAYCQFVRCAVPVCENEKLHTPVGQCCPVCEQGNWSTLCLLVSVGNLDFITHVNILTILLIFIM